MLEGETKPLLPVPMEVLSTTRATVTLTEGRYHQVRRMFAAVGNHVTALHRDRVGDLMLPDDLPAGQYRILGEADLALVLRPPRWLRAEPEWSRDSLDPARQRTSARREQRTAPVCGAGRSSRSGWGVTN